MPVAEHLILAPAFIQALHDVMRLRQVARGPDSGEVGRMAFPSQVHLAAVMAQSPDVPAVHRFINTYAYDVLMIGLDMLPVVPPVPERPFPGPWIQDCHLCTSSATSITVKVNHDSAAA